MKPFEFAGYPKHTVDFLIENGFLKKTQGNDFEAQKVAFANWREEIGARRPICPSVEDPSREAECLTCRDGIWMHPKLDSGKPDYGSATLCPACSEEREAWERNQRMLAASGIPDTHRRDDFASFNHEIEGAKKAFKAASDLAIGKAGFCLLMIYGGVGNGKSHLAYAACLEAQSRGVKVKWQPLPAFFADLRREMGKKEGDAEAIMDKLKEMPFLALDDPSTIFNTDWQESRLIELIDHRYARQLPTILVTNRDLKPRIDGTGKTIEPLPEQIVSRFQEEGVGFTVANTAPDYRKRSTRGRK
jgi:DNA replication protein DnaC